MSILFITDHPNYRNIMIQELLIEMLLVKQNTVFLEFNTMTSLFYIYYHLNEIYPYALKNVFCMTSFKYSVKYLI